MPWVTAHARSEQHRGLGELKTKLYALEEHRQRHLSEKLSELMQAQVGVGECPFVE